METYSGRIPVEDASGSRIYVYAYTGRRTFRRVTRYMLDTGEPVRRIDEHTFAVIATGEKLRRVDE
ncbi:MAG: hypothetical protein ACM3ZV_01660 [Bacillota bacterium]